MKGCYGHPAYPAKERPRADIIVRFLAPQPTAMLQDAGHDRLLASTFLWLSTGEAWCLQRICYFVGSDVTGGVYCRPPSANRTGSAASTIESPPSQMVI